MAGEPTAGRKYKIKLESGRVLGPLDLDRVALLIRKNRIVGTEVARLHPDGEWRDINTFTEIAQLLLARLDQRLGAAAEAEPADQAKVRRRIASTATPPPTSATPTTARPVTSAPVMGMRVRAGAAADEVSLRSGCGVVLPATETGGGAV